ncbi:MAG: hypothetical protein ABIK96_12365 [bacterium]
MIGSVMRIMFLFLLISATAAGEVELVRNGAQPGEGKVQVTLREVWRVGGPDGDEFFGLVPRVQTDAQGNVYVLDSQVCQVTVYDRDGRFLRTLFSEGEGPGEVRSPRDMMVLGDGRVGLLQEFPGAISFVDAAGNPAGRIAYGGAEGGVHSLTGCQASGDVILVSGTHMQRGDQPEINLRQNFLERIGDDGLMKNRYASNDTKYDFTDFVFSEREHIPTFWWCFDVAPDGRVYAAPDRDAYRIEEFAPDGSLVRVVERDCEPLARTEAEFRRMEGMVKSALAGMRFQPTIRVEHGEAAFAYMHRALQLHPDGSLWVLSSRGVRKGEPGVMAVFDVFDREGRFARQVALRAPHEGQRVGIFLSGRDRILVVKGFFESLAAQFGNGATFSGDDEEVEVPEVICYEMVK